MNGEFYLHLGEKYQIRAWMDDLYAQVHGPSNRYATLEFRTPEMTVTIYPPTGETEHFLEVLKEAIAKLEKEASR